MDLTNCIISYFYYLYRTDETCSLYLLETDKLLSVKTDTSQNASGDNTNDGSEQSERQLQVREENKEGNSEKQSTDRFVSVPLN